MVLREKEGMASIHFFVLTPFPENLFVFSPLLMYFLDWTPRKIHFAVMLDFRKVNVVKGFLFMMYRLNIPVES